MGVSRPAGSLSACRNDGRRSASTLAARRRTTAESPTQAAEVLIFDGDCGFCTTTARWIEGKVPAEVAVVPWQSLDLSTYGLTEQDVSTAAYFIDENHTAHRGHKAVELVLKTTNWPTRAAGIAIVTPPLSWIAPYGYALVAKYRYRLPGATDACRIPQGLDE